MMQNDSPQRLRRHRLSRRVNVWILASYVAMAPAAAALKAWQTAHSHYPVGWIAKTNAIIWDIITLAGAIGVLALGVREMVLAYLMRKEYEEDLAALLHNQQAQAEMVKAQAAAASEQSAIVQAFITESREQREAEAARLEREQAFLREQAERDAALQREQAERDAALQRERAERDATQIRQLTQTVQELIQQNRQLMARLDRQHNGHATDNAAPDQ